MDTAQTSDPTTSKAVATDPSTRPVVQRFAELRVQDSARKMLRTRSSVVMALRRELHRIGFVEVDTPLLQTCSRSSERSFRTETESLGLNTYLRTSPFFLRGVLTTGIEKVFEIGRTFRDEPVDRTHSPEYSLIELYEAGADYCSMRSTAQTLVLAAATAVLGTTTVRSCGGEAIDLAVPWAVTDLYSAVSAAVGQTVEPATSVAELRPIAARHLPRIDDDLSADELVLELYDRLVESATVTPTFYVNFPVSQSPLAEACGHDERLAQKWDLVIDGREVATGYTELADSKELTKRLTRGGSLPEVLGLDSDWIDVFSDGMPQAGGLCVGLERLLLTITGARSIRDVIPFPIEHTP